MVTVYLYSQLMFVFRNGRLPALIDHTNNDYIVWESGAILLYVAERFDTTGKFSGKTLEERAEVWQWLMFQVDTTYLISQFDRNLILV